MFNFGVSRFQLHRTTFPVASRSISHRSMAAKSEKASLSHEERTAEEPRNQKLHPVTLSQITKVNERLQVYKFAIQDQKRGVKFRPGQWLDVHVPGIEKAGGFTITSPPQHAIPSTDNDWNPYLELAVQQSPDNPPAAWLWQPKERIIGKELTVRVGGSFVWPPNHIELDSITRVVMIAGGVGINPLISMLTHIKYDTPSLNIRLIYSTKLPSSKTSEDEVLFVTRILDLFRSPDYTVSQATENCVEFFFTGTWDGSQLLLQDKFISTFNTSVGAARHHRTTSARLGRIDEEALQRAIGNTKARQTSVFYVCGPPEMTDDYVGHLRKMENVSPDRVMCEKWW